MTTGIIIYHTPEHKFVEKDYSVIRLLEAGRAKGIDMRVVLPEDFELVVTRSDNKSIFVNDERLPLPDFVLPRLGSRTNFFAGSVIRQLEYLGVYVCNNVESIMGVKDKLQMHQKLAQSKLATPTTMLAKFPVNSHIVDREIGFPLVIKNVSGMQGAGIYLCDSEDKFVDVMELIYTNNSNANIILQEFIKTSRGQDLRVFVVGGRVIGCMHRSSKNSFKSNFSRGGEVKEFEITPEIEWLSTEASKLLGLDIAGVDLLFDETGFKVCEVNSAPGFIGLEKVMGKVIAEAIIDYILVRTGLHLEEEEQGK
jgi:RimK family alpha-L-glutamate ligase